MNDTSSFFIESKALFGSYPTQDIVNDFEKRGVCYFIDLTTDHEKKKLLKYETNTAKIIRHPIKDNYIPIELFKFSQFICRVAYIIQSLKDDQKIYIHCKGGHGRAGIVVACLLCFINCITSYESLKLTNQYHEQRPEMKEKWRSIGSPQTSKQKEFVIRLFKPIYLDGVCNKNTYFPLNNNSKHVVIHDNITYRNLNECLYTLLYPRLKENIKKCKNFHELKKIICNQSCQTISPNLITSLFEFKLKHYDEVRMILKKTLIRPILYKENNILNLGILLNQIRYRLFLTDNFIL